MDNNSYNKQKANTLVEVILYMAITAILAIAITSFLSALLSSRSRFETVQAVDNEAVAILEVVNVYLRNATTITALGSGSSANFITFDSKVASANPVTISVSGNTLQLREGAAGPFINLNSSNTSISAVLFTNVSQNDLLMPSIRLSFSLTSDGGDYTQNYYETVNTY
ncbi:prepilin-type N-terminal cleavage/methylation domain-containing protein [Candidatus Dojkabacteria bacterium]|uniref:Prepilin-type N-terminal cleavage/methylation domain-containing protein n=1 Tax=Candidatus Dojkabacteria bacterium TaxID=2099670 RepID=A0A955KYK7_9BACT|nr:prepilin-type N-terminal cleavage/methylation domain-containing protein [Candidatus Dojkabacteria bacterium]